MGDAWTHPTALGVVALVVFVMAGVVLRLLDRRWNGNHAATPVCQYNVELTRTWVAQLLSGQTQLIDRVRDLETKLEQTREAVHVEAGRIRALIRKEEGGGS